MVMRAVMLLSVVALLGGCAAGTMMGAGQGGQAADGRSYEAARADNLLAAAVNRALVRDKAVNAGDIRVSVRDAVVTLTGTVPDAARADRVVRMVQELDGVKAVVNQLQVSR